MIPVNIQYTKSRAEAEAEFLNNRLLDLRKEKSNSKKMVDKYSGLLSYN